MKHRPWFLVVLPILFGALLPLSGCSSIAKGVTEGVLASRNKDKEKDPGICDIHGTAYEGLAAVLERQHAAGPGHSTKVLMVHGIGRHLPGYSARLQANLSAALGFNVVSEKAKEIQLRPPPRLKEALGDAPLGNLRILRHTNKDETRELLFYELTWSSITDPQKDIIAFDNSYEYAYRRAALNNTMKDFLNSHIPDPIIYTGDNQLKILTAVNQGICWVYSGDWEDLPDGVAQGCDPLQSDFARHVREDELAIITHSLGSRISIDALQSLAQAPARNEAAFGPLVAALKDEIIPVYMLANQLPLLQLGFTDPKISNQVERYCTPAGDRYGERLFRQMRIVAFSDPNDILSYPIPAKFAEEYIDSQLCPKVINVIVNVAPVIQLPVFGGFANPARRTETTRPTSG